jgi:four helix bundle protein
VDKEVQVAQQRLVSHKELKVWQLGMELAQEIYRQSASLPADERFGLTVQMRRAAVSIPSNVAEGAARGSTAEFLRFLAIASGSLAELETQVLLGEQLGLWRPTETLWRKIRWTRATMTALRRALRARLR